MNAAFIDLMPTDARAEGGKPWSDEIDLKLMVKEKQSRLEIFLRRADETIRKATVSFPFPPATQTNTRIRIMQRPVQGHASLTLVFDAASELPAMALTWDSMGADGRTEEQILEYLDESGTKVPPTLPIAAHWEAWRQDVISDFTGLRGRLSSGATLRECVGSLGSVNQKLSRPHYIWEAAKSGQPVGPYRLVDQNGNLPTLGIRNPEVEELFRATIKLLNDALAQMDLSQDHTVRGAAIKTLTRFYGACPDLLRRHLFELAARKFVIAGRTDFRGMGRVFSTPDEFKAFFGMLFTEPRIKLYHVQALADILLLRKSAAMYLQTKQAETFCGLIIDRLHEYKGNKTRWTFGRACIRALVGLLRFRQSNASFLTPGEKLSSRVENELIRIAGFPKLDTKTRNLATRLIEFIHEQGVADELLTLLGDDDEDGPDGTDDE